jgi:hypothetical protein
MAFRTLRSGQFRLPPPGHADEESCRIIASTERRGPDLVEKKGREHVDSQRRSDTVQGRQSSW